MSRFSLLAAAAAALTAGFVLPSASQAKIQVDLLQEGQEPSPLVSFSSAKCRKAKKKKASLKFIATAKKGGYTLHVNKWKYGRELNIQYGGDGPVDFTVDGPAGNFTNLNRPPNAPPGGGALVFNRKATRMGLGFSPAFNGNFGSGIDIAGGLKCKYPKKKKRRRH